MNSNAGLSDQDVAEELYNIFYKFPLCYYSLKELSNFACSDKTKIHDSLLILERNQYIVRCKVDMNGKPVTHWHFNENYNSYIQQLYTKPNMQYQYFDEYKTMISHCPNKADLNNSNCNVWKPASKYSLENYRTEEDDFPIDDRYVLVNGVKITCNNDYYQKCDDQKICQGNNQRNVNFIPQSINYKHGSTFPNQNTGSWRKDEQSNIPPIQRRPNPTYTSHSAEKNYSGTCSAIHRTYYQRWKQSSSNELESERSSSSASNAHKPDNFIEFDSPEHSIPSIQPHVLRKPDSQFESTNKSNVTNNSSPGSVKIKPRPKSLGMSAIPEEVDNLKRVENLPIPTTNELMTAMTKNPVSVLHEFAQQRGMECDIKLLEMNGPSHKPIISIGVILDGRVFDSVTATNKKEGKRNAAEFVIRQLIAEGHFSTNSKPGNNGSKSQSNRLTKPEVTLNKNTAFSGLNHFQQQSVTLRSNDDRLSPADPVANQQPVLLVSGQSPSKVLYMAGCVHTKVAELFGQLSRDAGLNLAGRKVVAAIIMETGCRDDDGSDAVFDVVALATGNRCITGDKISLYGMVVNDCHAEVIVRRAFLYYLYQQLWQQQCGVLVDQHECLFDEHYYIDSNAKHCASYSIKPHIKFHIYISTAPCGDSALFCTKDNVSDNASAEFVSRENHCPIFDNSTQGQLRSKIEGGEGTIPVPVAKDSCQRQTLDGILRGERLKTMSCSDKLARWNYLGLQGSLLSQMLQKPVFIETIILGNLFNPGHLSRAVCCRLCRSLVGGIDSDINHPDLASAFYTRSGEPPQREIDRTNELSINWCRGVNVEVIDGVTGLLTNKLGHASGGGGERGDQSSRLSKAALFAEYQRSMGRARPGLDLAALSYRDAKSLAGPYEDARASLYHKFHHSRLGSWVCKPAELSDFRNRYSLSEEPAQ